MSKRKSSESANKALEEPTSRIEDMTKWINRQIDLSESFAEVLLRHLSQKGYRNDFPMFYNKIYMDRRLFSKLISESYKTQPTKKTVLKIIIGLELTITEAEKMLSSAGYCFNSHDRSEMILKYCIEHEKYSPQEIDRHLLLFGENTLFTVE